VQLERIDVIPLFTIILC